MNVEKAIQYIKGELSSSQKTEFEDWLHTSMRNFEEFEEFRALWMSAGKRFRNFNPDKTAAWNKIRKNTIDSEKSQKGRLFPYALRIAAAIVLIIGFGTLTKLVYQWSQTENLQEFRSENFIMTLSLSDGTRVWLKPGSSIIVPENFKGDTRKVVLKGNAFFEVTRNPEKPFIISAHHTITKVLGTSFYLEAADSMVELSVVTGKVSLADENNPDKNIIILPGQKGSLGSANREPVLESNTDRNFLAWRTGKLQFDNASFDEVCKTLSEYYEVKIDPGTLKNNASLAFSGKFENKSLIDVLNIVELTLGVKFVKNDKSFLANPVD